MSKIFAYRFGNDDGTKTLFAADLALTSPHAAAKYDQSAPAIDASVNTSSISDDATGYYTHNLTNAFTSVYNTATMQVTSAATDKDSPTGYSDGTTTTTTASARGWHTEELTDLTDVDVDNSHVIAFGVLA